LLSRRTQATIKSNLFWAFGYNTAVVQPGSRLRTLSTCQAAGHAHE